MQLPKQTRLIAFIPLLCSLVFLSGCMLKPSGSRLSTIGKKRQKVERFNLSDSVKIVAVTPELVKGLAKPHKLPQSNLDLASQVADYDYKVGAGDILSITVWDHPELAMPQGSTRTGEETGNRVYSDGTIFYPYIGKMKVEGMTSTELRDLLTEKLSTVIKDPQIDVSITGFRSKKIYVTGEVKQPGTQALTNVPLTLLDAVNGAGGLTANADWENVTLTRGQSKQQISLRDLLENGDLTQNLLLQSGDVLHIPLNDRLKVFVMGEVKSPATLQIGRSGLTLADALGQVGGLDPLTSDATGVFVIRGREDEQGAYKATVYQLDMTDASALYLGAAFFLQPYDAVYVTRTPFTAWHRIVAQLLPTVSSVGRSYSSFTSE